jgi:hypothetical protein
MKNKWVHEDIFTDPNAILQKTVEETNAYAQIQRQEPASETGTNQAKTWRAPIEGWHKANWDVAIDKSNARVGIKVVLRDERWIVIAVMCKTRMGVLEPITGEACAAYHVVCLCRDLGVQNLLLEGDAKQIVEAINLGTGTWSRFRHLIEDTRRILLTISR